MYKVHEILIPTRFCILMLQLILTIIVAFSKADNIYSDVTLSSTEYKSANSSIIICLVLFYITEGIELFIIFSSYTLFLNKLSLIQIFFHSIGVLLLAWFIWKQWIFSMIWLIWGISGVIPLLMEMIGLIYIRLHYRKVLKIT